MSGEPQLFRVDPNTRESNRIEEVDFARLGLRERQDIQEWVAANPGILGDDLLIIGKEFSGFDRTNERLDLLAVDFSGRLVIIELKRDDTGADAHWQAIKYSSYFQRTTHGDIVGMAAAHWGESQDDAVSRLQEHLGADDLSALNNDQRIILASHRFAPEVTSAALWLNKKLNEDLITCIKLTPYRDVQTDSLYVQVTTIIPVPGIDDYLVNVGQSQQSDMKGRKNNFAVNLQKAYDRNKDDDVTHFLRQVDQLAREGLPEGIRPDRASRWAGRYETSWWGEFRYYHFWYSHGPWSNHGLCYRVHLSSEGDTGHRSAHIRLVNFDPEKDITGIALQPDQSVEYVWGGKAVVSVPVGAGMLDGQFAERIAETLRYCIEQVTPIVDDWENESNEAGEA